MYLILLNAADDYAEYTEACSKGNLIAANLTTQYVHDCCLGCRWLSHRFFI